MVPRKTVKEAHYYPANRRANNELRDLTVDEVLVDVTAADNLHGSLPNPRIPAAVAVGVASAAQTSEVDAKAEIVPPRIAVTTSSWLRSAKVEHNLITRDPVRRRQPMQRYPLMMDDRPRKAHITSGRPTGKPDLVPDSMFRHLGLSLALLTFTTLEGHDC